MRKKNQPGWRCCPGTKVCVDVCVCGVRPAGQDVTVSGPDGFGATCTTNDGGWCCVTVPGPGTYTGSTVYEGTTYSAAVVVSTGGATARVTIGTRLRACVTFRKCSTALFTPGDPFPGLSVRFVQVDGATTFTTTGTTDSDGQVCVCLPSPVRSTVYVDAPPCPYQATSFLLAGSGGCDTVRATFVVPFGAGYTCGCRSIPVPWEDYQISTTCGTFTLPLSLVGLPSPARACLAVPTTAIAYFFARNCGYGPEPNLTHTSGVTGMQFRELTCGPDGWSLTTWWPVKAWHNCLPTEWVYGYPPWSDSGCWDFTLIPHDPGLTGYQGAYFFIVRDTIPLTGTVTDRAVSLTGVLEDVWIPPDLLPGLPGMWVTPPCTGAVSVTRTWCGPPVMPGDPAP